MNFRTYFQYTVILSTLALIFSCSKSASNETTPKISGPVISSLSAYEGAFRTQIVIYGSGFGANKNDNLVYFNGELAEIDFASTQQLTVEVPLSAGSGNVSISVDNGTRVVGPKFTYIPSAIVSVFVGGNPNYETVDGQGTGAAFKGPTGLAFDQAGNLYVADPFVHAIRKVTSNGLVSTIFRQAIALYPGDNDEFNDVAVDNSGNVYSTDASHHTIHKITPQGDTSTFAGNGTIGNKDGALLQASFSMPTGIVIDKNNTMYITDQAENTIRKISNGVVSTIAGGMQGASDGLGSAAMFYEPTGIAIGPDGNLYIADTNNHNIRKMSPQGMVTTIAGTGHNDWVNGVGTKASFSSPFSIAADRNGNLYVGEIGNSSTDIRKIAPDGTVSYFAGNGDTGQNNGPGNQATFINPISMVCDISGNLYVADGRVIRKVVIE